MSPEDHLRRLRDDESWTLEPPRRHSLDRAAAASPRIDTLRQALTATVVGAMVVGVTVLVVTAAPTRGATPAHDAVSVGSAPRPAQTASPSAPARPIPSPATPSPVAARQSAGPVAVAPSPVAADPSPSPAGSTPRRAQTHGALPALAFVAADAADVARGERAVTCLHAKGVEFVDLAPADAEGVRYLEFGGPSNDRRSITLGLQYANACIPPVQG